jgi:hypothetical protein
VLFLRAISIFFGMLFGVINEYANSGKFSISRKIL